MLPAFVVGEGGFDGDAVGGVFVALAFPLLDSAGQGVPDAASLVV